MTERIVCVRCGQEGHRSGHCPWPAETKARKGRYGHAKYAQILGQVMAGPVTVAQVMAQHATSIQTTREILWRMERLGLARVCEWREPVSRSYYMTAVFGAADGRVSLPYPRPTAKRIYSARVGRPRSELTAFASIVECLRSGATRKRVHEETGVAYMRVASLIHLMRGLGICHRSDWIVREGGAGKPAEVFSFGPGSDAPALKILGRREVERRNRERKKCHSYMLGMIQATAGRAGAGLMEPAHAVPRSSVFGWAGPA